MTQNNNPNDVFFCSTQRLSKSDAILFMQNKIQNLNEPFFIAYGPDLNGEIKIILCGSDISLEKNSNSRRSKDQMKKIELGFKVNS